MILLLAISPQSCKCKNGSDWLKKLADAKIIFIRQEYNYTRGLWKRNILTESFIADEAMTAR